jgi:hypothetical protein
VLLGASELIRSSQCEALSGMGITDDIFRDFRIMEALILLICVRRPESELKHMLLITRGFLGFHDLIKFA